MTSSTENLAKLIRRKRDLLVQMLTVGLRQLELINEGNISDLLRLLSAKQQLINALLETENGLNEYRDEDPAQRQWATPEARATCVSHSNDCQRIYEQVLALEQEQEQQLGERRDGIAEQLRAAQSAQLVRKSYEPHSRPNSPHQGITSLPTQDSVNTPHSKIAPIDTTLPQPGSLDLTSGN